MDISIPLPYLLALLFILVSFVYSSVGLGGGSAYIALMAIFGLDTMAMPMVALLLNLFVTSVGSYNFIKHKHAKFRLIYPFLISSIPLAYLGGYLRLPTKIFYMVLLVSLIFVALRIYFWQDTAYNLNLSRRSKIAVSLFAGSVLGLIAGISGIGGGIYLIPLIIILGLGSQKEAAGCGVIFIWLNSMAGLLSRLQHNSIDLIDYIPMIIAVLIGGFLGSFMGSTRFSPRLMEKILGGIIIVAIGFLIKKLFLA